MQIGLIVPPWLPVPPPRYGGTEQVVGSLARGLLEAGQDVVLFTTGDSTCEVPIAYAYPTALRDRMGATVPEFFQALEAYDALKECQIIHDHTIAGLFVAAHLGRAHVIATSHSPFTPELIRIYGAIDREISIVAISHDQASQAPELHISRVIHHGLDPDEFELGPGGGGYLLFLGRMSPDKGVHIAARVARAAGRRLIIAAKMEEPSEERYFDEQVKPLLGDEVIYVGEVDRTQKKDLLAKTEGLVNPIRWHEPFGLVMVEALASGAPVIAFSQGAAPEIVDDGVTGFLCHSEAGMVDALARLHHLDRRECRRRFEGHFTVQNMVEKHLDLYEEVSKSRKSTAA